MASNSITPKSELLPCPFCGGRINDALIHIGHLDECLFLALINHDNTRDYNWWAEAWNTRA